MFLQLFRQRTAVTSYAGRMQTETHILRDKDLKMQQLPCMHSGDLISMFIQRAIRSEKPALSRDISHIIVPADIHIKSISRQDIHGQSAPSSQILPILQKA